MQSEEQRLIDGLFSRLKETEDKSAPRDTDAAQLIQQHLASQPNAAYYMAQTILIQEAAIKQLNNQVQALEKQQSQQQSSGGFLSGLFGGNSRSASPVPDTPRYQSPPPGYNAPQMSGGPGYASRGGGFMAGALQTAAGVAGGVVLANMLTGMFDQAQPQELVNIINEPAQTPENAAADINQADDNQLQNASWSDDNNNYGDSSSDYSDSGGDDFGGDGGGDI